MFCPRCGKENDSLSRFCCSCGADLGTAGMGGNGQEAVLPSFSVFEYAGFWRRFLAAITDGIVIMVIYAVVGVICLPRFPGHRAPLVGSNLGILTAWLYYALMESSSMQATLGKMALGIRVTDLNGNRVSFGRATGRHFAKIISTVIFFIGYIMAGFTSKKQALHDIIAGCLVIKKTSLQPRGNRGHICHEI